MGDTLIKPGVQVNKLRVVFVLTEPHEFKKYSGMDGLLEFYKQECGLTVYNRAIPDFQIPTQVSCDWRTRGHVLTSDWLRPGRPR